MPEPSSERPADRVDFDAVTLAEPVADDDVVVRRGLIFRSGDYSKSHGIVITPDDLRAAVADFSPCPLDLEHRNSVLDGHLGTLRKVELGGDGSELYGDVEFPRWLDRVVPPEKRTVSCSFNRETKRLNKLALVVRPHIKEAVLFSEFSATHPDVPMPNDAARSHGTNDDDALAALFAEMGGKKTHHGQAFMQDMHDSAARAGAICRDADASFVSKGEQKGIQKVHDVAVKAGATCTFMAEGEAPSRYAMYSESSSPAPTTKGTRTMSLKETVKSIFLGVRAEAGPEASEDAVFTKGAELVAPLFPTPIEATELRTLETVVSTDTKTTTETPQAGAAANFTESAEFRSALDAALQAERTRTEQAVKEANDRVARIEAARHAEQLDGFARDSAAFCDRWGKKINTAQAGPLAQLVAHLSLIDASRDKAPATVDFAEGRVSVTPGESDAPKLRELLDAVFENLPDHGLFDEMVKPDGREVKQGYLIGKANFGDKPEVDHKAEALALMAATPGFTSAVPKQD